MNRLKSLWKATGIASPVSSSQIKTGFVVLVYVVVGIPVVLFVSATCVLLVTKVIGWAWAATDLSVTNVIAYGLFGIAVLGGVQSFFDWANR